MIVRSLAFSALLLSAAPALADVVATTTNGVPLNATEAERAAWKLVFTAIRSGDYAGAQAMIDARAPSPLGNVARAELALAKGAKGMDGASLAAIVAAAPDLPQAPAIAKLAKSRGAADLASLPVPQTLVRYAGASKRQAARPTRGGAIAARLLPLCKANDGATAEPLLDAAAGSLDTATLAEWRERVAWAYYLGGDDAGARRMALLAASGEGDWAVQGDWVAGLAAWRAGDHAGAAQSFHAVTARARDPEMLAAALYWAARADMAAGHPDLVEPGLRTAARASETFYGLLAAAQLGLPVEAPAVAKDPAEAALLARPNIVAAQALAEIGETILADRIVRQQARIGLPAEHGALIRFAEAAGLPDAQVWLAANGPRGGSAAAARYPAPAWSPAGGWRVDRALVMAHALQESQFRADAVSPAGARGLMQLMPGTAQLVARHKGDTSGSAYRLNDPAVSFEYGQSYLEELAQNGGTGGLLPKVIAAYNAGPNNVAAWNLRPGMDDPLLFIESIPFAETRGYVAVVLRNYWMYQRQSGAPSESLAQLAAGKWPRFPTLPANALRTATAAVPARD